MPQELPVDLMNDFKAEFSVWDKSEATESTLKMKKNTFYYTLKALRSQDIEFLSWYFGHVEKQLD